MIIKRANKELGDRGRGGVWFFDTYQEAAENTRQVDALKKDPSKDFTSRRQGSADWSGTKDYSEAMRLAVNGWPEGREKMSRTIAAAQANTAIAAAPAFDYDVAGAFPVVPEYVSGNPEHMLTPIETISTARPIVRLLVNRNTHAGFKAKHGENFHGALLSWIDALEGAGNSVELKMVACADNGDNHCSVVVTLKNAGEVLELDRLAFALVHMASYRRIIFGNYELQWHEYGLWNDFSYGYGRPCHPPKSVKDEPGVIYIPGLSNETGLSPREVSTPQKAAAIVEQQIAATETGRAYIEAAKEQA